MVKIVADTVACLTPEVINLYHIPVVPQVVNFGTESYLEGVDIDIGTFMQKLRASRGLPKTAAPPVECFVKIVLAVFGHKDRIRIRPVHEVRALRLQDTPLVHAPPVERIVRRREMANHGVAQVPGHGVHVVVPRVHDEDLAIRVVVQNDDVIQP